MKRKTNESVRDIIAACKKGVMSWEEVAKKALGELAEVWRDELDELFFDEDDEEIDDLIPDDYGEDEDDEEIDDMIPDDYGEDEDYDELNERLSKLEYKIASIKNERRFI